MELVAVGHERHAVPDVRVREDARGAARSSVADAQRLVHRADAYAGIRGVDAEVVEAARGMGLTEPQILRGIEVPLAAPVILGGVRSAAVQVVATTTLGAIFALGGLGRYVVDGIAQNDDGMLFGGVVLVGALAMAGEGVFAGIQRVASAASAGTRARA